MFKHIIYYDNELPEGFDCYKPLPLKLNNLEEKEILVPVGYVPDGKKASIIIGLTEGGISNVEITVNGKIAKDFAIAKPHSIDFTTGKPIDKGYCPPNTNLFKAEINAISLMKYNVKFKANTSVTISYIEIEII